MPSRLFAGLIDANARTAVSAEYAFAWRVQRYTREQVREQGSKGPVRMAKARQELPFLTHESVEMRDFVLVLTDEGVVGMASLGRDSHRVPGAMALCFLAVREDCRGQGIARALVRETFAWAAERRQALAVTRYLPPTGQWARRALRQEALRWPQVEMHEHPDDCHV